MKAFGQQWVDAIERSPDLEAWVPYVSEIAAGSRQKYALDKRSGQLQLHRAMADGVVYPTNYGFVPRTLEKSDGMELDLLAISTEPLLPLTIAHVRLVGGVTIYASDSDTHEDKLLGAVIGDPDCAGLHELGDVSLAVRAKIETFFTTYKLDEHVTVKIDGWFDRTEALDKLRAAFKARKKQQR